MASNDQGRKLRRELKREAGGGLTGTFEYLSGRCVSSLGKWWQEEEQEAKEHKEEVQEDSGMVRGSDGGREGS